MQPYDLGALSALTLLKIAAPVLRTGVRMQSPYSEVRRQLTKAYKVELPEFDLSKMIEQSTKMAENRNALL